MTVGGAGSGAGSGGAGSPVCDGKPGMDGGTICGGPGLLASSPAGVVGVGLWLESGYIWARIKGADEWWSSGCRFQTDRARRGAAEENFRKWRCEGCRHIGAGTAKSLFCELRLLDKNAMMRSGADL
jgi:hypothetical protein